MQPAGLYQPVICPYGVLTRVFSRTTQARRLRFISRVFLIDSGPVLPTLRFSRKFGLAFCGVAGFLEDVGVACFT